MGVLLADEVGLGKTIEAALVMGQFWAERRRRLLVICPASLRKQWAQELSDKFSLPSQILDARTWKQLLQSGYANPLDRDLVSILSLNYAATLDSEIRKIVWDLAVIDEAHKLRNAHRESHRTGQAIKRALAGTRKVLLTATPLQNSLLELYGLSTILDEHLFGDRISFQRQYMRSEDDHVGLQRRLGTFAHRTLRRDVQEYVQYTNRNPITIPFTPSADEERLYQLISGYIVREGSYGFPPRQRHLVGLVLRKLLASSTEAVIATLGAIRERLVRLRDRQQVEEDWFARFVGDEDLEYELEEDEEEMEGVADAGVSLQPSQDLDMDQLNGEIAELEQYIDLARRIREDEKSFALLKALETGFERMAAMGAPRKAVVFTESRRTQEYLAGFLERHGYVNKVTTFSGTNNSPAVVGIYQRWLQQYGSTDRATGSPAVDRRTALIDHFRDESEILIATEAGSEGINLQFCALVVNYDLPWNPQRVEQRIGRCHRYGQKFDVVVVNFLNQRNAADRRVLELLSDKFQLFEGVFGASDEILGRIESGVDVERRIAEIYDTCRTPEQIDAAFRKLREDLETSIDERMRQTERALLEHFDESIWERLRVQRERAEMHLDRITRLFWRLTRHILADRARFDDEALAFELLSPPADHIPAGSYRLQRKGAAVANDAHVYRLTHPLGEYVLDHGRRLDTPRATLAFRYSSYPHHIAVLDNLPCKNGWLTVNQLALSSFQEEEYLVVTAQTDDGAVLDAEACERLFNVAADLLPAPGDQPPESLTANADVQLKAALNRALEENNKLFQAERDKLDRWAEDQIYAAEQALEDTKAQLRQAKRQSRQAQTVEEQKQAQEEVKRLERQQRRQRQEIFDVEDEIERRRDQLIEALEKRLHRKSETFPLFTIRWSLV